MSPYKGEWQCDDKDTIGALRVFGFVEYTLAAQTVRVELGNEDGSGSTVRF